MYFSFIVITIPLKVLFTQTMQVNDYPARVLI